MDIEFLESGLQNKTKKEMIEWLFSNNLIPNERICISCNCRMNFVDYKRNMDKFAQRCMNSKCGDYKKYFSIRDNSFFSDMKIDFVIIFRLIGKQLCKVPQHCIISSMKSVNRSTIQKLVKKLVFTIPKPDFTEKTWGSWENYISG